MNAAANESSRPSEADVFGLTGAAREAHEVLLMASNQASAVLAIADAVQGNLLEVEAAMEAIKSCCLRVKEASNVAMAHLEHEADEAKQ